MKSCIDCKHMKAKIPVKQVIQYDKAVASCALHNMIKDKGGDRTFKNIIGRAKNVKAFNHAERCPDYSSMIDQPTVLWSLGKGSPTAKQKWSVKANTDTDEANRRMVSKAE